MENIDLKTYSIDNMKIRDIMSNTYMGNLNLKDLFVRLTNKFTYFNRNLTKREYLFEHFEDYERELIINGILLGEVIENNLNRPYFNRDRSFTKDGKFYEDIWLTTLWVALSKIFEEETTLSYINNMKNFDGKFIENENAPKVNSNTCINSEPDFIWIKKDGSKIMVEQKCSYNKQNIIKIRKGQMKNFSEKYNDEVIILLKDETDIHKDEYSFYYYKDIKPFLKEANFGGNIKSYVTELMLRDNNIYPFKFFVDAYLKGKLIYFLFLCFDVIIIGRKRKIAR